jgi:hypothetical protein
MSSAPARVAAALFAFTNQAHTERAYRSRRATNSLSLADWMRVSLNPLKSNARLFRYGLQWFAEQIHLEDLPNKKDDIAAELDRVQKRCDDILIKSPILAGLNLENDEHAEKAVDILKRNRETCEWWAFLMGTYAAIVRDAITAGDAPQAVWAMGCAERCRAMLVFKEHLEEVVWMGQSARRVVEILSIWDQNQSNSDEGFWQQTFREHVYAIAQVFAVPLIFIKEAAYVGGTNIDRKNAKLVDYLFSLESSQEAALVEIKTPATRLLGPRYRGTYGPSSELSGAIMQALDYRRTFVAEHRTLLDGTGHTLKAVAPRSVVVAGNGKVELGSETKRIAFELFRANSRDVEIVTYDELFRKLDVLAQLFSLSHVAPAAV